MIGALCGGGACVPADDMLYLRNTSKKGWGGCACHKTDGLAQEEACKQYTNALLSEHLSIVPSSLRVLRNVHIAASKRLVCTALE